MRVVALILTAWLVGCADNTATKSSAVVVVDTVNGIEHVRNSGTPAKWELEELLTLGAVNDVDTGGANEFARITGVIADTEGNIYVADSRTFNIRVFDEGGRFLRTIGRKGGGPGEFETLQSIGWLGDTLVTMDGRNARIGLMTSTGEWQGQRPFGRISGSEVRFTQTAPAELYSFAFVRRGDRGVRVFVRQTHQGDADTLLAPHDPSQIPKSVTCSYNDAITFFSVSFAPSGVKQPAPNVQRLDYWSGQYRLHFVKMPDDTVRIIERDIAPLAVTDEEWAKEEAKFRAEYDKLPPSRSCNASGLTRPDSKAMILGVIFDDQGRMWVERRTESGSAFDVFSPEGHLLAELEAPQRLNEIRPYVRGDRLYLATTDSLDVQYVKAYQITR
jgi:hypothetical protein